MLEYTGFRPQAQDESAPTLSLDGLLVTPLTFFALMTGNAMARAGIRHGTLLVIEPQEQYRHDQIVLAFADHQAFVRRLERAADGGFRLVAAHPQYAARVVDEDCLIRGRVIAHFTLLGRSRQPLPQVS